MGNFMIGIDQSTQGTKAILMDENARLIAREDLPHKQIVNDKGWVEHDPEEIIQNTCALVRRLIEKTAVNTGEIKAAAISNQRETAVLWNKATGEALCNAIVWQCARGEYICNRIAADGGAEQIRQATGLRLSPYFTAAKIAWAMENIPQAKELAAQNQLCCGTMDSWLLYKLTKQKSYKTDYSNASRTQLFNITALAWDAAVCKAFGIPVDCLAEVTDSNGSFGDTDFGGALPQAIPIMAVMGDSHGALYGQGCITKGLAKATYGTGSSVMMNIGDTPLIGKGVVTSIGWRMDGKTTYVLEGNINYSGAVITWLKDDLKLIQSPAETETQARLAHKDDTTYLIPAFSGLSAPHWDSKAQAAIVGMTRRTGKNEIIRAALASIAHQITDVVAAMAEESGIEIKELRVDGGPTKNGYLMQLQSDLLQTPIRIPTAEELSCIGVCYAAGCKLGLYQPETVFEDKAAKHIKAAMAEEARAKERTGWKAALGKVLQ